MFGTLFNLKKKMNILIIGKRQTGRTSVAAKMLVSFIRTTIKPKTKRLVIFCIHPADEAEFWKTGVTSLNNGVVSPVSEKGYKGDFKFLLNNLYATDVEIYTNAELFARNIKFHDLDRNYTDKILVIDDDQAGSYFEERGFTVIKTKLDDGNHKFSKLDMVIETDIELKDGKPITAIMKYLVGDKKLVGNIIRTPINYR